MRKLVTKRTISNLAPIEGADKIEVATVDGWECVVKKGEFFVGQEVAYFEIDSFLPEGNENWQFLVDRSSKVNYGIRGHILRTVKLKGQISQGLVLNSSVLDGLDDYLDYAEQLGIKVYEPESNFAGENKPLPVFIPKTDQERIQNLLESIGLIKNEPFTVTEKLEGLPMTVFFNQGEYGVCTQRVRLDLEAPIAPFYCEMAKRLDLEAKLAKLGRNIAVQGELVGPKIQSNLYKLNTHAYFIFSVWDIDRRTYLEWWEVNQVANTLGVPTVPVLSYGKVSEDSVKGFLESAKGFSKLNPETVREGIVMFRGDAKFSFKVINNDYLLKGAK